MKNNSKLRPIVAGIGLALGIAVGPAQGSPQSGTFLEFYWEGLFTMLGESGSPLANTSMPYYYDPTWGYGYRTPVSGTLSLDTNTGSGSFTVHPFSFFQGDGEIVGGELQAIGDGTGDVGTLVIGNALFNWNYGATGIPLSIVWDASGLFQSLQDGLDWGETITGIGATPASDGIKNGNYPIGPAPLATTTWNTTTINCVPGGGNTGDCMGVSQSGGLPLLADGVGGSPFVAGPFEGYSLNLDITSLTHSGICLSCPPPPVPIPAAVWLFGSGLAGLLCLARRGRREVG
jgi:hypothetical protein